MQSHAHTRDTSFLSTPERHFLPFSLMVRAGRRKEASLDGESSACVTNPERKRWYTRMPRGNDYFCKRPVIPSLALRVSEVTLVRLPPRNDDTSFLGKKKEGSVCGCQVKKGSVGLFSRDV